MLLSNAKHKLVGQVRFTVSGLSLEKLINLAFMNNIKLYEVKRLEYTKITAITPARQYVKLKSLLPEGKYTIEKNSMGGGAQVIHILRRRYALLLGILVCTILMFAASQRVWMVSVSGCSTVSSKQVEDVLKGYSLMGWKGNMGERLEQAEQKLLTDMPQLSWASLSVRGVVLHAYVKEKPPATVAMPKDTPADIVATKNAVIENVTVLQGTAEVKKGQTVAAGQTLISGQLVFSDVPYKYISAQGTVTAKVWYFDTVEMPLTVTTSERTGNKATVRTMNFLGNNIVLSGTNPFAQSECEEYTSPVTPIGLPFEVVEHTYYETVSKTVPITEAEAISEAERRILDKIQLQIDDDAIYSDRNTTYEKLANGNLKVTMYIETIEKIGYYKEIK